MTTRKAVSLLAALPDVTTKDHFGAQAFARSDTARKGRVGKIFATVWHEKNEINLMVTPEQQAALLGRDGDGFSKVPNKWGDRGATTAHLAFLEPDELLVGVQMAYESAAPKPRAPKSKPKSKPQSRSRRAQ